MINLMKIVGVKLGNRRTSGKGEPEKPRHDKKTLRHSRSLPLRDYSDAELTTSTTPSRPSPDSRSYYPVLLQSTGDKVVHVAGCDCVLCCGDILVQFPAPPQRPRRRPRDLSQDISDVAIIPYKVEMARQKSQQREVENQKIRETVEWYTAKSEVYKKTREAINMTQEQYKILRDYHPQFRMDHKLDASSAAPAGGAMQLPRSLGPNTRLSGKPMTREPEPISRKPSLATMANSRPVMVKGLNQTEDDDGSVYSSYDGGSARHSLNPHGRRNLQGYPAVARLVSDDLSSRKRHEKRERGHEMGRPSGYSSSTSTPAIYGLGPVRQQTYPLPQSGFTAAAIRARGTRGHQASSSIGGSTEATSSNHMASHLGGHARSSSSSQPMVPSKAPMPAYKAKAPAPIVTGSSSTSARGMKATQAAPPESILRARAELDSAGKTKKPVPVRKVVNRF